MPIDKKTRELIKSKHRLAKKVIRSKTEETQREYRRVTNKLRKTTRNLRKNFESSLAKESKTNPKVIWKYVKSKSKTKDTIGDLYKQPNDKTSVKVDTDREKAEVLSSFFGSILKDVICDNDLGHFP